jgi:hypothetical protein
MNGNLMYEMARQRIAEQQRAAQRPGKERREAGRGRRARAKGPEAVAAPVIPDFAHEMFDVPADTVPAPREESARGRRARTNR